MVKVPARSKLELPAFAETGCEWGQKEGCSVLRNLNFSGCARIRAAGVAGKSCGCSRRAATILPARGFFSASCATGHLPSEINAVSASAKKKLAPAKTKIAATACPIREVCRKSGRKKGETVDTDCTDLHRLNL